MRKRFLNREDLMLFFLYRSTCTSKFFEHTDIEILRSALKHNSAFGITGFLHRNETHFFQYFEGEEFAAKSLMDKLIQDIRHYDLRILMSGETSERLFPGWSMGYSNNHQMKGIDHTSSPEEVLQFLRQRLDRQIAANIATAEAKAESAVA